MKDEFMFVLKITPFQANNNTCPYVNNIKTYPNAADYYIVFQRQSLLTCPGIMDKSFIKPQSALFSPELFKYVNNSRNSELS